MASSTETPAEGLPPRVEEGIFSVSASVVIDAPRDKVWEIITDFPSYKEWCVYVKAVREFEEV